MPATPSPDQFENLSWHDCGIWRIEFRTGEPEENDWTSDLVLGIDYICEWLCGTDNRFSFRVAPALLSFHNVTAASIGVDWRRNGDGAPIHDLAIHRIDRERDDIPGVTTPHYRWTIRLNWPEGGIIAFKASGFSQRLLCEPVQSTQQCLTTRQRSSLLAASATSSGERG